MRITNAGSYRGRVINFVVNPSSGGFPQFVADFVADEYWDTDGEPAWVGLQDKPDISTYMVLVDSKEQKTLNCKQIETVFGWDGVSLVDLDNMNLAEAKVQFRVEERTYTPAGGQPKTQMQVTWISEYDAAPGRKVSKLEPDAVKALNAKFSKALGGKIAKPATAPKAPPQAPQKLKAPVRQPTAPKVPTTPGKCTMEEAFASVSNQELWKKGVDQKKVEDTWLNVILEIAGNKADADITPEEWYKIKGKVESLIFVF